MTTLGIQDDKHFTSGLVTGTPNLVLRAEGLVVLMVSVGVYHFQDTSWWLFAALFLIPDIFMLGYLAGNRMGAISYNIGHTYLSPALLALLSWELSWGYAIAIIWVCHIGFDRLVGYGLKYQRGFKFNHLSAPAQN